MDSIICPEETHNRSPSVAVDANRTFEKTNKNRLISIDPPVLKFVYQSKPMTGVVNFHTLTGRAQLIHILPPEDKAFSVDQTKCMGLLRPGIPHVLQVTFRPVEKRLYSCWLKVICREDVNLMIPLEASPYTPNVLIPKKVDLGCLTLGAQGHYALTLHPLPHAPLVFGFFLPNKNVDLRVSPVTGQLEPGDRPVVVEIVYTATAYTTVHCPVQLFMPAVSKSPFLITVVASCQPGVPNCELRRDLSLEKLEKELKSLRRPLNARAVRRRDPAPDKMAAGDTLPEVERQPESDCRDPLLMANGNTPEQDWAVYQKAQKEFLQKVERYKKDNAFPPIKKSKEKLGQDLEQLGPQAQEELLIIQQAAWNDFEKSVDLPPPDTYLTATETRGFLHRPMRDHCDEIPRNKSFNNDLDAQWIVRYHTLSRFVEAARTVLVLNRLKRHLAMLKQYRLDVISGKIQEEEEKQEV